MDFEWDPAKARTNENKHGVSFFEACEVFADDHSSAVRDPDHALDENRYLNLWNIERWQALGCDLY